MPALTIKGIPQGLLERLRRSAEANRRSLNAEVIHRLDRITPEEPADTDAVLARAREIRERAAAVWVTDADLRSARNEGRP